MYFFFHLLTGLILGFLLSEFLHDQRWLLACAAGAVLPDLIDKPIGYIFFPATIGYGRIYSHTILVALLILALGFAIWKVKNDPGVMGVGVGVLSHQILDLMWRQPSNWYYPLLGPFEGEMNEDYLWTMLMQELNNPFELGLALLVGAVFLAVIYRDTIAAITNRNRPYSSRILIVSALLLCILSGIIIGWGISHQALPEIGWSRPEELILGGMVIALSAYLVWRWQILISKEMTPG